MCPIPYLFAQFVGGGVHGVGFDTDNTEAHQAVAYQETALWGINVTCPAVANKHE